MDARKAAANSVEAMTTLGGDITKYVGGRIARGEITTATAKSVRCHLHRFADVWGKRPLNQLGPKAVEMFIESMEAEGLAKSTQCAHLSSLRTFARWLTLERRIERDFTMEAPKIRRPRSIPRDMVGDHFALMLGHCRDERERLMLWLMYGCGLRCIEVSRLDVEDYDGLTKLLFVTGKAGHQRQVPVPEPVRVAMAAYLATVRGPGPMIRSHLDGYSRIGANRISNIVQRIVRDAGLKVRNWDGRSAHGLRAAAASDLFDVCHDPTVVQAFLGHANLQTVQVYLRRTKVEAVAAAQDARIFAA